MRLKHKLSHLSELNECELSINSFEVKLTGLRGSLRTLFVIILGDGFWICSKVGMSGILTPRAMADVRLGTARQKKQTPAFRQHFITSLA